MKLLLPAGLGLFAVVVTAALAIPGDPPPAEPAPPPPVERDDLPPTCAGGCSAASPHEHGRPDAKRADAMLAALAGHEPGVSGPALDDVLYYWRETAPRLEASTLDPSWKTFLRAELARTEARVKVRVIGVDEKVHVAVDRILALDRRTHLLPSKAEDVQPPEVTLTVRRVGLGHIWTRV